MLLNRVAVGIITDKGYVVMGDTDGVKETLHNLNGGGSSEESAMRQALDRLGDGWQDSGLVSAQTYNTANTHCAPGIRYNQFCQSTSYYTTYAGGTLCTSPPPWGREDRNSHHVRKRAAGPVRIRSPRKKSGEHRDLRAHRREDHRRASGWTSRGSDSGTRSSAQEEGKQTLLGSTDIDEARSMERHTQAASRKDNRTWRNSGT